MVLAWFSLLIMNIGRVITEISMRSELFLLYLYPFISLGFFTILLLDSISRETIDPKKICLFSILATAYVIFSLEPNAIIQITFPNMESSFTWSGNLAISGILFIGYIGFLLAYYTIKIFLSAPKNLQYSVLFLVGGPIIGIFVPITMLLRLHYIIPGSNGVFFAVGTLLMTIAMYKHPQLAYILPFKVIRLSVFQSETGFGLFTKTWSKSADLAYEDLFSGMLLGITALMNESLNKGNIREIHLEQGILLIKESLEFPIAFVLISNKSSSVLRGALSIFADKFIKQFDSSFSNLNLNITSEFKAASTLVDECFKFIPEYD